MTDLEQIIPKDLQFSAKMEAHFDRFDSKMEAHFDRLDRKMDDNYDRLEKLIKKSFKEKLIILIGGMFVFLVLMMWYMTLFLKYHV